MPTPGQLAAQIQAAIDDLRAGRIDRGEAAALAQLLNAMRGAMRLDYELRETAELRREVRELRDELGLGA